MHHTVVPSFLNYVLKRLMILLFRLQNGACRVSLPLAYTSVAFYLLIYQCRPSAVRGQTPRVIKLNIKGILVKNLLSIMPQLTNENAHILFPVQGSNTQLFFGPHLLYLVKKTYKE